MAALALLATALAPLIDSEQHRLWMLLTYPPRLLLTFAALVCVVVFAFARAWLPTGIACTAVVVAAVQIGWGAGTRSPEPVDALTLLAFNVKDATRHVRDLRALVTRERVDVLVLQEVKPPSRQAFIDALPEFEFVWGDETARFEHDDWGPFSSMTGFRRGLNWRVTDKSTGMTGYRTFAVAAETRAGTAWFVNVHTTKAFWLQGSPTESITRADYKSAWHAGEHRLLREWLSHKGEVPVILAGDFNAPHNVPNLDFPGMRNAHLEVGSGAHLTFPAKLPVWGIDHVLANDDVTLHSYQILAPGFSDHRTQLVRFSL